MAANMVVRTNIFSLNAHRNMKNVGLQQRQASNRLSSGYRINSAADDAAGLAISETMRAQIRGLDQASRNAQDGQAMILTTEGGLEEIGNMLQRVRELLVQASNDTNTQDQRTMIEQEIAQLGEEVFSMQTRVEFNTNQVLNLGDTAGARGLVAGVQATLDTAFATFTAAGVTWATAQGTFSTASGVLEDAIFAADNTRTIAINAAIANHADSGHPDFENDGVRDAAVEAAENARSLALYGEADHNNAPTTEAERRLVTDGAWGTLNAARGVLNTARGAWTTAENAWTQAQQIAAREFAALFGRPTSGDHIAWFQVGANANQGITFDFETVSSAVSISGALVESVADRLVATGSGGQSGIGHGEAISVMITEIQSALDAINNIRANLGAVQNRMDYTMRSLDISSENLSDAESRVRNADMAREMMRFTMTNVLQQAATAMLAQANQMPNNLLQLLR